MAAEWYYGRGGQQHGPITAKQLKELAQDGQLQPSDLVWKEGMDGWKAASSVKGLFPPQAAQGAAPPPLPSASSQPSPASSVRSSSGGLIGRFFGMMSASTFTARWILKDDPKTWIEFSIQGTPLRPEYVFTRSNGDIGKWELVEKGKSIILTMAGKPAEQMTVLRHETKLMSAFLDVQDENGVILRFKKGKTEAGQAVAKLFGVNRAELLVAIWREANDSEKWCQFTDDGAFVAGDGAAGRYTFSGEQPDEMVAIQLTDGTTRTWKVVSLTSGQLIVAEDGNTTIFRKDAKDSRKDTAPHKRMDGSASADGPAPGDGRHYGGVNAEDETQRAIQGHRKKIKDILHRREMRQQGKGGGFSRFIGRVLGNGSEDDPAEERCGQCGSKDFTVLECEVVNERQAWMEDDHWSAVYDRTRPQAVYNIKDFRFRSRCNNCGHEWNDEYSTKERA